MTKLVRCGINFYADVDHQKAVNDRDSLQNTKLMEHYTHLLGQLQYEGAGIWSRFNIMFGINVSLFGLETVLFNSICQTSEYLTFIIAFGGLSFSIWSIYVMQRLWSYHEHWKNMLCEAERLFRMSMWNFSQRFLLIWKERKSLGSYGWNHTPNLFLPYCLLFGCLLWC